MARRKKDNTFELAHGLALLIVLPLALLGKSFLPAVSGLLIFLVASTVALGIILLTGWFIRSQTKSFHLRSAQEHLTLPRPSVPPKVLLLDSIRELDWFQFEQVMAKLYERSGYAVTRTGGANPDGGIDFLAERENETIGVQCKHWKSWAPGVKPMREFLGALAHAKLSRGHFVTMATCTEEARALAAEHQISIVSEPEIKELLANSKAMSDPNFLDSVVNAPKRCPKCEQHMVLRIATKGKNSGGKFWGCSSFPRCRYTMAV